MNTSRHTPGPWRARESAHRQEWSYWIEADTQRTVAAITEAPASDADARLIAAAPDLLAACEAVEEAWAGSGEMADAVDACLLAIASARGKD